MTTTTVNSLRLQLIGLLKARSLKFGDFTLASGRKSSYYIDARLTTMSAAGLELVGELGLALIRDAGWQPATVGGLTLGADPVAYAIALASRRKPPVLDAFTVRKEAKAHGTARLIEGCFQAGQASVVAEDVLTTGGSALRAVDAVRAAGGTVVGVVAVVDREEGGSQALRDAGLEVLTMARIRDLGIEAPAP